MIFRRGPDRVVFYRLFILVLEVLNRDIAQDEKMTDFFFLKRAIADNFDFTSLSKRGWLFNKNTERFWSVSRF